MSLDDVCHSADLHGFHWHDSLDVDPVFISLLGISRKYVAILSLMIPLLSFPPRFEDPEEEKKIHV